MGALRKQKFDQNQLSLCLNSPIEHSELVHAHQVHDVIAWVRDGRDRGFEKDWYALTPMQTQNWLIQQFGIEDLFLTPNEFDGWRRIALLRSLNAIFLDFDLHSDSNPSEQEVRNLVDAKLEKIRRKGWPAPNAIVYSGRGVHFYWLHDKMPKQALPRWQEMTRLLAIELDADRRATDCTRVLRWIGSVHSGTGRRVTGEVVTNGRYQFEDLYRQFLPPEKKAKVEIRDIIVARAKRDAGQPKEKQRRSGTRKGSIYQWWYLVYEDLLVIARHHAEEGLPKGSRMLFVELFAHALSWYTLSEALEDEIIFTARMVAPSLSPDEVVRDTWTLITRARKWAEWNASKSDERGKEPAGRYKFKRETIFGRLSPFIPAELYQELRAIVPAEIIKERKTARDKGRDRVEEGRWASRNTGKGVRSTNLEKQAQARLLRARGDTYKAIAEELKTPLATVARWCKS